jgi:hypothetical protein
MVAGVQRMAHQHGVAAVGIERAVGFEGQRVVGQHGAALQRQRLAEVHGLSRHATDGTHEAPRNDNTRRRLHGHRVVVSF